MTIHFGKAAIRAVRYRPIQAVSALALMLSASAAQAEDAPPPPAAPAATTDNGIQDIVVTAQRRSESAQRTALSIDVIGGDSLRNLGVAKPDDLSKMAPGLQIAGGTTTQIYVRGVGDFGVTATANPAVITSIDGVTVSRPQAISGNFFDIERVELLKGPQGTLYGRNASGGALNVLTVQPRLGETSGYIQGTIGNYNEYGLEGAFNLPAGTRGALRLSYQLNSRDGYLSDGSDDDKHGSVRLQGKFELTDRLTVKAEASYTHLGGEGSGLVSIPARAGQSPWTGNTTAAAGNAYLAAAGANFVASNYQSLPPALLANPNASTLFQNVSSIAANLQIDYKFDFATLTVIPAWRYTHSRFAVQPSFLYNVGGVYDANGDSTDGERSHQYSLEARLAHESASLKWVLGGYYFKETQSTDYALQGGLVLNTLNLMDLGTQAGAVFAQATWTLAPKFRLTGGARYTSDKRTATNFHVWAISPMVLGTAPSPYDCVPGNGAAIGTLCPLTNPAPGYYDSSVTFNKLTWKAGFETDIGPQSLLFGDVSTGFKAGGFNQAVSLTNTNQLQPYNPETVTSYTLGIKNRFFHNLLQVNAEVYYLDYSNLQLSAQAIDGAHDIVLLTQNAGKARIAGAELDVVAKPWTGGTIHGAVEYDDTKYRQFQIQQLALFVPPGRTACPVTSPNAQGLVTIVCSGQPLIRTPNWSGNVGISQAFDLVIGGKVTAGADLAFAGSRYLDTDFTAAELAKGYANLSLNLTYSSANDRWFISGFVNNVTNAVIYTGGGGHQSAFVTGWVTSNIAPPRTYGARFGVKF